MKIILNGQEKELSETMNLQSLVGQCCRSPEHVIAEVNGDIVKKDIWNNHIISEGDSVELVSFVGGG